MLRTSQASRKTRTGAIEISRDSRAKPRFKQTTPSVSCVASTGWASSTTLLLLPTPNGSSNWRTNFENPEHALVVLWQDTRLDMIEWEGSEHTQVPRRVGRWWRGVLGDRNGARLAELEECASQDAAFEARPRRALRAYAPSSGRDAFAPRDHSPPARRVGVRWVRAAGRTTRQSSPGWSEEGAPPEKVLVGAWYCNFVQRKIGDRLRAAVTEPAVLAALNYLEQQPPRPRRFTDAEQTSRRVIILHRHVESACGGYVPRAHDAAELAGWSEEGAPPEKVRVGAWYCNFVQRKIGDRLRAAVTEPAVLAALNYLEQQPPRPQRFTDAGQTSRRVIIMQRHVESACGGYVPRATRRGRARRVERRGSSARESARGLLVP